MRLQDAQVGALAHWVSTSRGSLTRLKLGQLWPWDFDGQGKISGRRDSWGEAYDDCGGDGADKEMEKKKLGGGKKVPAWTDAGLPLSYTSSHRIMVEELEAVRKGAALKREAEEEAGRNACVPVKKPRHGSVGTELKRMKQSAEQEKKGVDEEKERYLGAKPELRDAMKVVDTLMRSASEAENQNIMLGDMLLKNEARYIKDTDDMFDEWLTYNEVQRKDVFRILEDHAAEIRSRNVKLETFETRAKKLRACLEREKRRVEKRDECLANAKSRWVQERDFREAKNREIEDMEIDLGDLSEFHPEFDESEDEEAGPREAEEDSREVKKQTCEETKQATKPAAIGQANTSLSTSMLGTTKATADCPLLPQDNCVRTKSEVPAADIEAKDLINLDDEEEDGPITSHQKRRLRSSARGKAARSS